MIQDNNGYFGSIQGPFLANQQVINRIQEQCRDTVNMLTNLSICYQINYDINIFDNQHPFFILINGEEIQLGKTGMLELQQTQITSLKFKQNVSDKVYINYTYT